MTRTCAQCMHLRIVNNSPIDHCPVLGEFRWANSDACNHFNAPTGLYWIPDFVEQKDGHIILLNWQLRRPSEHNQCGYERLGKLRRTHDGWIAARYGQPVLVWKRSDEGIKRCARALVARVKGETDARS